MPSHILIFFQFCMSIGMLSKSKGQILRVSAVLHVLFHIDTPHNIPETISEDAVKAADNFVDLCLQQAAYLAGTRFQRLWIISRKVRSNNITCIYINRLEVIMNK